MTVKIWRKLVKIRPKQVNDVYGLKYTDMSDFKAMGCKLGSWLAQ